jgi:hypothetical protein
VTGQSDDKPTKPGQIKPSIPDHNLDPGHGLAPRDERRQAPPQRSLPNPNAEHMGDARPVSEQRFPAGLLLAPAAILLLVAASADQIAAARNMGLVGGIVIALLAGGGSAACVGVIAAKSEPSVARIVGPLGLVLATMAAGFAITRMI